MSPVEPRAATAVERLTGNALWLLAAASRRGGPIVWFAAIATGLTAPVWRESSAILGGGLGDNASFLWNFWWARLALADPQRSLFTTDLLCAPLGTSLVLHTGTPLLTVLTAVGLPNLAPLAAYNLWIWLGLFLNGACAYLAAHQVTGRRDAACLAGTIFAAAPFLVVRANGHLNVLNAWGLPLLVFLAERLYRHPNMRRAVVTGAALGAVGFVDYYYFIFAGLLAGLLYVTWRWSLRIVTTPVTRRRRWVVHAALAAIALASSIAAIIAISGGTDMVVGTTRISLHGTFNLRVLIGYLAILAAVARFGPRVMVERRQLSPTGMGAEDNGYRYLAVVIAVALLVVSPLAVDALRVWMDGDYVAPTLFWRAAPPGLDAATLLLGNPTSRLFGHYSQAIYQRFAIDDIESIGWLGVVPAALLVVAIRRFRQDVDVRRWLIVLAVFGVWSLGPYLTLLGTNTGLMLPHTALRFVPLLNNARIPGRAYTVVILGVALIAALVVSHAKGWRGRRWAPAVALAGLTLLDFWPRPFRTTALDRPTVYDRLAAAPKGVLLELPVGLRDGFGERGRLDHGSLYHQTLHGQPLVGGFVARLSTRIIDRYETDAVLAPLLALSAGDSHAQRGALAKPENSLACSIHYVVIPAGLSGETLAFVHAVFRLEAMATTPQRSLYAVTGFHAPYCQPRAPVQGTAERTPRSP